MSTSVKANSKFVTTDRVAALRLQLMATELSRRIGTRIAEARQEKGLNQRQLADLIAEAGGEKPSAITNQRISDWERGVNKPSERYMRRLAHALDREIAWFYAEEEDAPAPELNEVLGNGSQLDRVEQDIKELRRIAAQQVEALALLQRELQLRDGGSRRRDAGDSG